MSQKTYTGLVSEVSQTPWKDRDTGNDIILHSFRIESSNVWWRTGETDPKLTVGDCIKFVARRQNVDPASIEAAQISEVPDAPKPEAGGSSPTKARTSGGTMSRNAYWEEKDRYDKEVKQKLIGYQSARSDATALVVAALNNDCLALGQKKADKLDLIIGYVEEVTGSLYEKYRNLEEELNG